MIALRGLVANDAPVMSKLFSLDTDTADRVFLITKTHYLMRGIRTKRVLGGYAGVSGNPTPISAALLPKEDPCTCREILGHPQSQTGQHRTIHKMKQAVNNSDNST